MVSITLCGIIAHEPFFKCNNKNLSINIVFYEEEPKRNRVNLQFTPIKEFIPGTRRTVEDEPFLFLIVKTALSCCFRLPWNKSTDDFRGLWENWSKLRDKSTLL